MDFIPPAQIKGKFLEENHNYVEIEPSEAKVIGSFEDINENVDEIWILQCRKGTKIKDLENQKIKFPGRVKFNEKYQAEAISSSKLNRATFGYANRKHHYAVRSLPIAGEIVISKPIVDTDSKISEIIEEAVRVNEDNVPMPEVIKIRHPLLGSNFDKYLKIDADIQKRLKGLDASSKNKRKHLTEEVARKVKLEKIIKTEKPDLLEVGKDLEWLKQI